VPEAADPANNRLDVRLSVARLGRVNTVLAAVVVILVVLAAAVFIGGARVLPWTTPAEAAAADYDEVKAVAEDGVIAFLDVDYRDMDPRIQAVKEISTGTFGKEYTAIAEQIRQAAIPAQAISKGKVKQVGIRAIGSKKAVVLVAVDSVVTSSQTAELKKSDTCPYDGARCSKYRFKVSLAKTKDGWRMSDLAGVN